MNGDDVTGSKGHPRRKTSLIVHIVIAWALIVPGFVMMGNVNGDDVTGAKGVFLCGVVLLAMAKVRMCVEVTK